MLLREQRSSLQGKNTLEEKESLHKTKFLNKKKTFFKCEALKERTSHNEEYFHDK
jgi:hypothetical protein